MAKRDPRSYESAVLHQTARDLGWEPRAPIVARGWGRFWLAVEAATEPAPVAPPAGGEDQ